MSQPRQTEDRLRESEERFRLLVESVKDYAIFMLDTRGYVASWNSGAERIKGYRADEIVGQHFSRFYPKDEVARGQCELELHDAARDGRFEDEGWRVRKDGSRFWANVVITALRDAGGELLGFAKVTRDLTERRMAELEKAKLGEQAAVRLHALGALAETLTAATTLEEVGRATVELGAAFVSADTCTLYTCDERTSDLSLLAEAGCNPEILRLVRRISPDNPLYPVGRRGAPGLWVEDQAQYAAVLPALAQANVDGPRAQAFACLPLLAEGRSVGMLGLGFRQPHPFSPGERDFIQTFARQCAQAIARAHRLQAERSSASALERLRASLSTTLRSIGDAVVATDTGGAITLMNAAAEALTGWQEAEAYAKPFSVVLRIVNEQTRLPAPDPVQGVLLAGGAVALANQSVLLTRDGREIPIEDSAAPIRAESGEISGVVLVFRDASERKRDEARRQLLVEATNILSQSLDYEQTVARVAELAVPTFADFCTVDLTDEEPGAPRRLVVAHAAPDHLAASEPLAPTHPLFSSSAQSVVSVLRSGRSRLFSEITDELLLDVCHTAEQLRQARQLRLCSGMIVPLLAQERVLGAISFGFAVSGRRYTERDLTFADDLARRCANAIDNARLYRSERQAREAADVASRAKDEFLAVVSHELRTPLNAILGWSQLLVETDWDVVRKQRAFETIFRNATTMTKLIEDLLDTSRAISGKLSLRMERVELLPVVLVALESLRPAAVAGGIELKTRLEPAVPPIIGDATRLQQIVWNLLSNAIKFSAEGGEVELSLRRQGNTAQVIVTDHGRGISAEFLPSVFEPFRQQDASSSREHGGLGLGLAISRQLVQLQAGQITAQSASPGHGATFRVSFPLAAGAARAHSPPPPAEAFPNDGFRANSAVSGLRVLVVDDDDDARELMASILEDHGCEVATASSAYEALQRLAERQPEVLLSDIGMPGEDGYDLIKKVRALPSGRGRDVPAAAITAYSRPDDRRRALDAGYTLHLPKPIEPSELLSVVARLSRATTG